MDNIHKLSENLINKIAAGEVIERPASILKELVENSIDANAKNITIKVFDGGKKEITVIDDGIGMTKNDIKKCFLRYTTSKIKSENDLFNILTNGFRGEALASMSSVSDMTIMSKTAKDNIGYMINLQNENMIQEKEIALNTGTTIKIEKLFENFPARYKYLKTTSTENMHIINTFLKFAIIHFDINFQLFLDNKNLYSFTKTQNLKSRVIDIFKNIINTDNIIQNNIDTGFVKIKGIIGLPELHFQNPKYNYIFVNNRPVFTPFIKKAVMMGYGHTIPNGYYPFYIINIDIDPHLIDVNVHPQKTEIRFENQQSVFKLISSFIVESLSGKESKCEYKNVFQVSQKFNLESTDNNNFTTSNYKSYKPQNFATAYNNFTNTSYETDYSIIGQIFDSYILIQKDDYIEIIDQHACHEIINFYKLKQKNNFISQKLLISQKIYLDKADIQILKENKLVLFDIGFDIDIKTNFIEIKSIPSELLNIDLKDFFKFILSNENNFGIIDIDHLKNFKQKVIASIACKKSIKFNSKLDHVEIEKLVSDFYNLDINYTCPHGRNISYKINKKDLSKFFNR